MTDKQFNQLLKQTLAPVEPRAELNQNLKQKMEDRRMKHFSVKKVLGMAAVCCLLVGTVSVASTGIVTSIVSHSTSGEYKSFSELEEAEKKAGFSMHAVEQFSNGYSFSNMDVSEMSNQDENGNSLNRYKGIQITYTKQGEDSLFLSGEEAKNLPETEEHRTPDTVRVIQGITVSYYVDTYKWVPAGYQLTPEDEANQQKDNYYISFGADEVSENQISTIRWQQDGIYYDFMNVANATDAETMFEMAEELICAE